MLDAVVAPERLIRVPVRTVLTVIGVVLAVWLLLHVVWTTRQVITWILIAIFFALALNPAVEWLLRKGVPRRGYAVAIACLAVLVALGLAGWLVIPPLVDQVNDFVRKVPDYIEDLTKGRGKLGFLETKYQIVERVREAVQQGDATKKIFGLSGTAISVTKSVLTIVAAIVTIVALTVFLLLEGPVWTERIYSLFPPETQPRWRAVGRDIARAVGGYVTGNLLISVIAGVSSGIVLWIMGVPFVLALGLLVAILDLVPLVGATIAAVVIATVSFLDSLTAGIVVLVFFVVYQQIENHILQPLIYGRTVQLSPLTVLVAVLIGASLGGVLGALGAIPVAGAIQVIIVDWRRYRRGMKAAAANAEASSADT
jgi:predicted PurR-regulated permease PerM